MSGKHSSQVSRKTFAIKRVDGEPLTRADIQYDLLNAIFSDDHNVFTSPHQTLAGSPPGTKVCFRDLYISSIMHSAKATKILKDKMEDVPNFARDFAMLALLTNVGRINTTMSFFPEMKTAIRTYHPIPALQRTNGNLQDAPRIKHILKACTLNDGDSKTPPSTPSDILERAKSGHIPSTTVTNLIFVMANHSVPLGQAHFPDELEFLDLFLPIRMSSVSRARAFLWLCYHYLESSNVDNDDDYDTESTAQDNPFSDQHRDPGRLPALIPLSSEEAEAENQDTEAENQIAEKLVNQRADIIKSHASKATSGDIVMEEEDQASIASDVKPKASRRSAPTGATAALSRTAAAKEKKANADRLRRERLKREKLERESHPSVMSFDEQFDSILPESLQQHNQSPRAQSMYRQVSSSTPEPPSRVSIRTGKIPTPHGRSARRFSPLPRIPHPPIVSQRSILQQAWHVLTHGDPLADSDEEFADEHNRHDYLRRLDVLSQVQAISTRSEDEHRGLPNPLESDPRMPTIIR
ncbi:hypothetical protein ONZ45_g2309 [Pleurotus djamor]|nr:hypothetical protein ONZ45_g2309 [Pleurotus djamor]